MLKGFRDFIMRGNVVDLAVGIVIGAAFTTLVGSVTDGFLHPIVNRAGGGGIAGKIGIGGGQALDYGGLITAAVNFVIVAAALYFLVVAPMNALAERRRRGEEPPPTAPSEEIKLLTEIRDALVRGTPAQRTGEDVPVYPSDSR
jgi:large conductance mechanosensitive channel